MVPLEVEEQVGPYGGAIGDLDVGVPVIFYVKFALVFPFTYSIPELADSTTAFLSLPSPVPRKATVKSPVDVAVTEVSKVGKVNTWKKF